MKWYFSLLIALAAILFLALVALLVLSFVLVHTLSHPRRYTLKETWDCDVQKSLFNHQQEWPHQKLDLTMEDGYLIHGDLYPNDPKKILIFVHGYTWTRYGGLKYASWFYDHGYTLYLYDQRSHGENVHQDVTMGYREEKDLHTIVKEMRKRFGPEAKIGIHGESMGAAVSLLEMQHQEDNLAFVIADSPFASLRELMAFKCRQMHVLPLVLPFSDLFLHLLHRYRMQDVEPKEAFASSTVPLLLFQGDADTMIPVSQSQELYRIRMQNTLLHLFPGVEHTLSYQTYPKEYDQVVEQFMKQFHLL